MVGVGRRGGVGGPCGLQVQSQAVIVCVWVSSTRGNFRNGP